MSKNKIINLMTHCDVCGTLTTKKNYDESLYYCDECNSLSEEERHKLLFPNEEFEYLGSDDFEQLMKIIYDIDIKDMTAEEIDEEMEQLYHSLDLDDEE